MKILDLSKNDCIRFAKEIFKKHNNLGIRERNFLELEYYSFPFTFSQTSLSGIGGQGFTNFQAHLFFNKNGGDAVVFSTGHFQYISVEKMKENPSMLGAQRILSSTWIPIIITMEEDSSKWQ